MKKCSLFIFVCCLFTWSSSAHAAEPIGDELELSLGARIGGYGFREVNNGEVSWTDCRMDGFGIFGALDLPSAFYVESSLELYNAVGGSVAMGMDRTSVHTHVSGGARFFENSIVTPAIHIGGGPEYTRIRVGNATRDMFLVNAFFGVGGELNLGKIKFGTHIRGIWSGLPQHAHLHVSAPGESHHHLEPQGTDEDRVVVDYSVGGQAQFWVRYVF